MTLEDPNPESSDPPTGGSEGGSGGTRPMPSTNVEGYSYGSDDSPQGNQDPPGLDPIRPWSWPDSDPPAGGSGAGGG